MKHDTLIIKSSLTMQHITSDIYNTISKAIIGMLEDEDAVESVCVNGLTYWFEEQHKEERRTMRTGVEFLGSYETYVKRILTQVAISFLGVSDKEDNDVATDFNAENLQLRYNSNYIQIEY